MPHNMSCSLVKIIYILYIHYFYFGVIDSNNDKIILIIGTLVLPIMTTRHYVN